MAVWDGTPSTDTVVGWLRDCVEECPDRQFIEFGRDAFTYGDVWRRATELAAGFRSAGVAPGQAVVTMFDNHVDHLAAWIGTNLVGGIWVGINTAMRGEFLRHVVTDTGARLVLCESEFVERFRLVEDSLDDVELLLWRGEADPGAPLGRIKSETLDAFRLDARDDGWFAPAPGDVSCLVYTGGTTGPSKGCVVSHNQVCNIARRTVESSGRTQAEVNWNPLPMFHLNVTATTIVASMLLRSSCSVPKKFSLSGFWPDMVHTGARVVNLLGSMGTLITQMPETPEMQAVPHGQIRVLYGSPFTPELEGIWRERFGVEVVGNVYGQTEAVPQTTLRYPESITAPPGSSGKRNDDDFDIRIFDDDDNEVEPGQVGEVVCRPKRPDVMFLGYWNRPEATLASMRNMWFHTGDLGRFDEDGFFWFVDRKKDYLRRRGENISSGEMETVYLSHPAISEVAVHAVPSDLGEDEVKVTAVLVPGASLDEAELFEWSKERVPYFALPRYIEFRPELPKSPTGRVHKFVLRDESVTATTWDRETAGAQWERR